jgi:hypothetical protein
LSHTRSRRAFSSVDNNDALLRLYCELIGLELILKDRQMQWTSGHDIYRLLTNPRFGPGVDGLANQLRQELGQLKCTDMNGIPSDVALKSYPVIRYLHRDVDKPNGATDSCLNRISSIVQDIYQQLLTHGVGP